MNEIKAIIQQHKLEHVLSASKEFPTLRSRTVSDCRAASMKPSGIVCEVRKSKVQIFVD